MPPQVLPNQRWSGVDRTSIQPLRTLDSWTRQIGCKLSSASTTSSEPPSYFSVLRIVLCCWMAWLNKSFVYLLVVVQFLRVTLPSSLSLVSLTTNRHKKSAEFKHREKSISVFVFRNCQQHTAISVTVSQCSTKPARLARTI